MRVKQLLYLAVSILTSSMDNYILQGCIIPYIQISVDELTPHKVLHTALTHYTHAMRANYKEL